ISGLCRGVVIVEAAEKSGALITATLAGEQGKEVFAIPGPVDSPASAGTLGLLKKGAVLVRTVDDILNEFGDPVSIAPSATPAPKMPPPTLSESQQKVFSVFADQPVHADELVQRAGMSVMEVSNALMLMEM